MGTTVRLLILVVAYNAEDHLKETLDRIPRGWLRNLDYHILILDDASEDETSSIADNYVESHQDLYITVSSHRENQGYGGNQKFGYRYAIDSGFDIVVLLHGDGQYAPEYLPKMVAPIHSKIADVVLGSRMIVRSEALKGGMPMYKWIGNQALTTLQNILLGSNLAEFHTGYRAYSVPVLSSLPIDANSDYFDFDTEILIQMIQTDRRLVEIPIPTFYGDEISYVNGIKYAWLILLSTLKSTIVSRGWMKDPRFTYS